MSKRKEKSKVCQKCNFQNKQQLSKRKNKINTVKNIIYNMSIVSMIGMAKVVSEIRWENKPSGGF